jgi:pyroglutamyl-peptidase
VSANRPHQTILLTGFEPFGGDFSNPSQEIAIALDGHEFETYRVKSLVLPVDGARAPQQLIKRLEALEPVAVIMLGLARGRLQIALERVALNLLDYRIPDNAGRVHHGQPIVADGPDAYFSTLPVSRILEMWHSSNQPGYVSNTAGLYLCNQVFYTARHHLETHAKGHVPAGFIHLPSHESLVLDKLEAFVPLVDQIRAVQTAIEVTAVHLARAPKRNVSKPSQ